MPKARILGLIPARGGSKRILNKNKKKLCGTPLINYTIASTLKAGIFDEIIVSTDDPEISYLAKSMGVKVPNLRPVEMSTDLSPDIDWVLHSLTFHTSLAIEQIDFVAILRPTNPFRTVQSIHSAYEKLLNNTWADSVRAMQRVSEHPGKMWIIGDSGEAIPFLDQNREKFPTYNRPTQSLGDVWVQNASLEISKTSAILETQQISGSRILGFEMPGWEGFDINTKHDWFVAEKLIESGIVNLDPN